MNGAVFILKNLENVYKYLQNFVQFIRVLLFLSFIQIASFGFHFDDFTFFSAFLAIILTVAAILLI